MNFQLSWIWQSTTLCIRGETTKWKANYQKYSSGSNIVMKIMRTCRYRPRNNHLCPLHFPLTPQLHGLTQVSHLDPLHWLHLQQITWRFLVPSRWSLYGPHAGGPKIANRCSVSRIPPKIHLPKSEQQIGVESPIGRANARVGGSIGQQFIWKFGVSSIFDINLVIRMSLYTI